MQLPFRKKTINYQLRPAAPARIAGLRLSTINFKVKHGFTLIELLVVISIIGILMAAGTVYFTNAQVKGRDSKRKADLKSLQQALELFYNANGEYPPVGDPGTWCTFLSNPGITAVKDALVPTYISKLPADPTKAGLAGDYFYGKTGKSRYHLNSILENQSDPERSTYNYSGCSGGSIYNYEVTQP